MRDVLQVISVVVFVLVLAFAITEGLLALGKSDADDSWSVPPNSGAWLGVRPPPGHEDAECWVFVVNQNFQTAYGGPACFAKVTP